MEQHFESQGSWQHCDLYLGLQLALVDLLLVRVLELELAWELARELVLDLARVLELELVLDLARVLVLDLVLE